MLLLRWVHAGLLRPAYPARMTIQNLRISCTKFYDSVFSEIEFGRVEQGINLLVGMLDAVAMQSGSLVQARADLDQHVLHQMLLEDPLYRHAIDHPNDPEGLTDILVNQGGERQLSSTGKKLFAVTSTLPIARALIQRRERGERASDTACTADGISAASLTTVLAWRGESLLQDGHIFLTAVLPDHLGSGWRDLCLNWNPQTHDEDRLEQAARAAGFDARSYRDESDCMIWATLRPISQSH